MASQRNPIDDLIVVETIPSLSAIPSKSLSDDIIHVTKDSFDLEDVTPTLTGRCLRGDGYDGYKDISWTMEEQKKAVRKVDFFLLPIFMVRMSQDTRWTG